MICCVCRHRFNRKSKGCVYSWIGDQKRKRYSCRPCNASGAFDRWLEAKEQEPGERRAGA
jgi:hypothetical protein